jgi:uncharacterized protein YjbI with pentapeptide repeats
MAEQTIGGRPEVAKGDPPPQSRDTGGVEPLLAALNFAAQRVQAQWIALISLGAYLAITVLGTTHRMLLLEQPVKLPLFNIDLPLTSFYVIAPALFVVFHFYLLVQLLLLARTASEFNRTIFSSGMTAEAAESLRMRVDNSVFVQILVGAVPERSGKNTWVVRPIALLTVIVLPIALLLLIELQFLPYHLGSVTWLHRGLLAVDLALVMLFWPAYLRGEGFLSIANSFPPASDPNWIARRCKTSAAMVSAFLLVAFACFVAAFPTERSYTDNPLTQWLFDQGVDYVARQQRSFFSNVLVVPDQVFVDDRQARELDKAEESLKPGQHRVLQSFRGRDLVRAVLVRADLRRSDFIGADLTDADFRFAVLGRSRFSSVEDPDESKRFRRGSDDQPARVAGEALLLRVNFDGAELQLAKFDRAVMKEATLSRAQLQGASLVNATMVEAKLFDANLQGADFEQAQLQGANLKQADLRGAQLTGASLEGADLERASLQGAMLDAAHLNGASLKQASAQLASFDSAHLVGALLERTDLQGASLFRARVEHGALNDTYLWRANLGAKWEDSSDTQRAKFKPTLRVWPIGSRYRTSSLTPDKFETQVSTLLNGVIDPKLRDQLLARARKLDPTSSDPAYWLKGLETNKRFFKAGEEESETSINVSTWDRDDDWVNDTKQSHAVEAVKSILCSPDFTEHAKLGVVRHRAPKAQCRSFGDIKEAIAEAYAGADGSEPKSASEPSKCPAASKLSKAILAEIESAESEVNSNDRC